MSSQPTGLSGQNLTLHFTDEKSHKQWSAHLVTLPGGGGGLITEWGKIGGTLQHKVATFGSVG